MPRDLAKCKPRRLLIGYLVWHPTATIDRNHHVRSMAVTTGDSITDGETGNAVTDFLDDTSGELMNFPTSGYFVTPEHSVTDDPVVRMNDLNCQRAITKSSSPDSNTEPSAKVTVTSTQVPAGNGLGRFIAARHWFAGRAVIVADCAVSRAAPTVAVTVAPAARSGAEMSTLAGWPAMIAVSGVTDMAEPGIVRLPKVVAGGG